MEDFEKAIKEQIRLRQSHIRESFLTTDEILGIEKGKKAVVGEVRMWQGIKQQKQPDGSWKPVTGEKKEKLADSHRKLAKESHGDAKIYLDSHPEEDLKGETRTFHNRLKEYHSGKQEKLSKQDHQEAVGFYVEQGKDTEGKRKKQWDDLVDHHTKEYEKKKEDKQLNHG